MNEKLRNARNDRRWTVSQAAERVGISRTTYIRWEQGTQIPHDSTLPRVAQRVLPQQQSGLRVFFAVLPFS
jgi:transcriptional regulator with XRE-family HTH domain